MIFNWLCGIGIKAQVQCALAVFMTIIFLERAFTCRTSHLVDRPLDYRVLTQIVHLASKQARLSTLVNQETEGH